MDELTPQELDQARELVKSLNTARKRLQIFPPAHPFVGEAVEQAHRALETILTQRPRFTLSLVDGEIFAEGAMMAEESFSYTDFTQDLEGRDLHDMTFSRGLDTDETRAFLLLTTARREQLDEQGGFEKALSARGVSHIALGKVTVSTAGLGGGGGGDGEETEALKISRESYEAALESVTAAFDEAYNEQDLNLEAVEGVVRLLMSNVATKRDVGLQLSTLKNYNAYTYYHSVNVAIMSLLMGARMDLDEATLQRLGIAALLHDIGKTRVPEAVLNKPGRLDDDEFKVMRSHAVEGVRILREQGGMDDLGLLVAGQHHVHYDFHGYPDMQSLGRLHPYSHAVTVADVYDALTSDRCYRKAMLPDRAMRIILEGCGTSFHPLFTKLFVQIAGMFPVGAVVMLDDASLAVVAKPHPEDIYRPTVRLLPDDGEDDGAPPVMLDLARKDDHGYYPRTIAHAVDPAEYGVDPALLKEPVARAHGL